ncbi:hypothetical protein V6N13_048130 [Hibiscus sabdariffa]|uniref:Uncharacterized protein n=1 Tax=Hibiscus sabdariffa TaxID=183260 RepID=A0ABR2F695_9ROSI
MEETGEVKDVGPEEHATRRARPEWEAEEPLEWGGDGLEAVDGWDWAERNPSAFGEDEREEGVEGEGGGDVEGDGGEEEGPGGAEGLGVAPAEVEDGGML